MMMPNLSSDVNTVHWVPRHAVNFSIYILSYLYFLYIYNLMMYLHISMYMHMPQKIYAYTHILLYIYIHILFNARSQGEWPQVTFLEFSP